MINLSQASSLKSANLEFRNGNYAKAITLYQKAMLENPVLNDIAKINIIIAKDLLAKNKALSTSDQEEIIENLTFSKSPESAHTSSTRNAVNTQNIEKPFGDLTLEEMLSIPLMQPCKRLLKEYDNATEQAFISKIEDVPIEKKKQSRKFMASIIMPTYNRSATIKKAIDSVISQTHKIWELIIIDDGSTDSTPKILKSYKKEKRIKVIQGDHKGVSAARNQGLEIASGDIIYYLDSDNSWRSNFLEVMNLSFLISGKDTGYSALLLHDEHHNIIGYRGEPFDRQECLHANYVDINIFAHRRSLLDQLGPYDTSLRRMVDWDLILRYTDISHPFFAPFIGCNYLESRNDLNRITLSEPLAFQKVVRMKNSIEFKCREELSKNISLNIAIKIPAPEAEKHQWGDYHYADSLRIALENKGHRVTLDFHGNWYSRPASTEDVVIVLRGLTRYKPRKGAISIIWNISHPDQISLDEYEDFDLIYVASKSYAEFLKLQTKRNVSALLQCSDPERFNYVRPIAPRSTAMLFVGNSRNQYRPIVKKSIESGRDISIYGTRWSNFVDPKYIQAENIANTQLCETYASHSIVLNDHWDSMRDYGFVSNRVFDVLASGSTLVTDPIPSISYMFGDTVLQLDEDKGFESLKNQLEHIEDSGENLKRSLADFVNKHHSFTNRANVICDDILSKLGLPGIWASEPAREAGDVSYYTNPARLRVAILKSPTTDYSHSEFIRLISPLTSEFTQQRIELVILADINDPRLNECDALIIQGTTVKRKNIAAEIVSRKNKLNFKILIDFYKNHLVENSKETTNDQKNALKLLMQHADHVWFANERLALSHCSQCVSSSVLPNTLDKRLWRNYRLAKPTPALAPRYRILILADDKSEEDINLIIPAFDELIAKLGKIFQLVILGTIQSVPNRPWIKHIQPNTKRSAYPHYAEWLMKAEKFDIGLIPRSNPGLDEGESDLDFLHMTALGLPVICSRSWVFEPLIKAGLVIGTQNTTEEWISSLKMAITQREIMIEMTNRSWSHLWNKCASDSAAIRVTGLLEETKTRAALTPKKLSTSKANIAVSLHLYYTEQWIKITGKLDNINEKFDLYITCATDALESVTIEVHKKYPDATIIPAANNGMDVLPFLEINKEYSLWSYPAVLKIHTKNTKTDDDLIFGNLCYEALLANSDAVQGIIQTLSNNSNVGMIGPEALYRSAKSLMYVNGTMVDKIFNTLGFKPDDDDWGFFAGTMFWVRGSLLHVLADNHTKLESLANLEKTEAKSGSDGTWAHAMERVLGSLASARAMKNRAVFLSDLSPRNWLIRDIDQGEFLKSLSYRVSSKWHLGRFANVDRWAALCMESELFDRDYYIDNCGGMIPEGMDPVIHYILYGDDLLLDPSEKFSTAYYKAAHPDAIKARAPFLVHYLVCGIKEGRTICSAAQY